MRDKNPDMVAGEKKKFVMRPPQVKNNLESLNFGLDSVNEQRKKF